MKAEKLCCVALCVVLLGAISLVGKEVTYDWKNIQFLGCAYFVPTINQNGKYVASEKYKLRGIWKKLEDGKVVDEDVPCASVDNVCIHDKYNVSGVENGGELKWELPLAALPVKFTVVSCKSGVHKFNSPDQKKSHDDNQQTKSVEIDRPVPSDPSDPTRVLKPKPIAEPEPVETP
jgi:hypothetical protein